MFLYTWAFSNLLFFSTESDKLYKFLLIKMSSILFLVKVNWKYIYIYWWIVCATANIPQNFNRNCAIFFSNQNVITFKRLILLPFNNFIIIWVYPYYHVMLQLRMIAFLLISIFLTCFYVNLMFSRRSFQRRNINRLISWSK